MLAARLVVVVALGVTGCTATVDGRAQRAPKPAGSAPVTQPFEPAPIQWSPCRQQGTECGELTVPIDYSKPEKGSATIALIRFRATGTRIGSLVVNPGGPGASGIDLAAGLADSLPASLRERFDIVGFDPRGVGASKPAVRCLTDAEIDQYRAQPDVDYNPDGTPGVDYSAAGVQQNEDAVKRVVQQCVDKVGTNFLANVGTANVVRDLDALRSALGENKLTYLGYSYGTEIGALYAEAYPTNVRAMVLDGPVDLSVSSIESMLAQAAAFQLAFNDFAADCAQSPGCPLGNDSAKAVERPRASLIQRRFGRVRPEPVAASIPVVLVLVLVLAVFVPAALLR